MSLRIRLQLVAVFTIAAISKTASAYDFIPTESEFFSWPKYCQSRYVTVGISAETSFPGKISHAQIESSQREIGDDVFTYVHHHCAGLIWVRRARYEANIATRKFYYKTALAETNFTFTRVPVTASIVPSMLLNLANASIGLGDSASALEFLQKSIDTHPDDGASYNALALFYRSQNNLNQAKETLIKGNSVTEGISAELNYNLALVLLELRQNEEAIKYARKAYELGYPLPGLRNRLAKLGLWEPNSDAKND